VGCYSTSEEVPVLQMSDAIYAEFPDPYVQLVQQMLDLRQIWTVENVRHLFWLRN